MDLWDNPMQTDGFEFVEYAAPDPKALIEEDQIKRGVLKPTA